MFNDFPREVGPPRKVVKTSKEWFDFINTYNGIKKAVYTSIYKFNKVENNKPLYETVVINCLFFDFDDKSCDAWKECNTLHQCLLEEKIKHIIIMSGRGYHLYILTLPLTSNTPKSCIYNAQHHFIDKLKISVDTQVIGNPAQLARVPNTFNIKGNRYCIPLTREQFEQGDEFVKKLATKQNFVKNITIGDKLLSLTQFDFQTEREKILFNINNFEDSSNADYMKNASDCIKELLNKKNIGFRERFLVILFFKEQGYTRQEVYNILKEHLNEAKFKHCILEERQLQYVFERNDLIFPKCDKLIKDDMCPHRCDKYNKILYK